jgi:transitional endoplasmic reticulum ATPase
MSHKQGAGLPDRERALSEDEILFAGVAGSETVGEAAPRDRNRSGREIYLRVAESLPGDIDKGYVRLHPTALQALGLRGGSLVAIEGRRVCVLRAEAVPPAMPGEQIIRMDGTLRDNVLAGIDDRVRVRPGAAAGGLSIVIVPDQQGSLGDDGLGRLRESLKGRVLSPGDKVNVTCLPRGELLCKIVETEPSGAVLVTTDTLIRSRATALKTQKAPAIRYEEIGGLEKELRRVRELVELPMKYPQLFARLRIEPPKGVLLYGPPGTGKTLIARAVAGEVEAHFVPVNGPEIMKKYLGESEATLREIFEDAQRNAPAIIFLDELDAIAPKRADVAGDVEKRVVAQLLTLMDGLEARGDVVVIAATNMPELVDPALRRPGRFDREVPVGVPGREGRLQILRIHARGMPLDADVDLPRLAELTHGFVGADLEVLCKEAGMLALHEVLDQADFDTADPASLAERARIHLRHFLSALKGIEPTATRELVVERPNTRWSEVGGLRDLRGFLQSAIQFPRERPELFQQAGIKPPKGILFRGPSGTGKSLVARALAGEAGLSLITADAASMLSKWLGESEKALRQVFTKARQAAPCILFFDGLDAIAPARGGDVSGGALDRLVGQFLSELDNLDELSEVVVLGATNRPDLLDPALLSPGRFPIVLDFPLPDEAARAEILAVHTDRMPLAEDVDLADLARQTEGLSGSDLAALCQRAALEEIRAIIRAEEATAATHAELRISRERFEAALGQLGQLAANRSGSASSLLRLPASPHSSRGLG